jgi:hypothetical protein
LHDDAPVGGNDIGSSSVNGNVDSSDNRNKQTGSGSSINSGQVNSAMSNEIAELKKMIQETQNSVEASNNNIEKMQNSIDTHNESMEKTLKNMNSNFDEMNKTMDNIKEHQEKVKSNEEKEIIQDASIDATKQQILLNQKKKERIQNIIDTDQITEPAKQVLEADIKKIDADINKEESALEQSKQINAKTKAEKVLQEVEKEKKMSDLTKKLIKTKEKKLDEIALEKNKIDNVINTVSDPTIKANMSQQKSALEQQSIKEKSEVDNLKMNLEKNEILQKQMATNATQMAKNQEKISEANDQIMGIKEQINK